MEAKQEKIREKVREKYPDDIDGDKRFIVDTMAFLTLYNDRTKKLDAKISNMLSFVDDRIKKLEVKYPEDKDLKNFRLLYSDLKSDFEKGRSLDLDDGLAKMTKEVRSSLEAKGVKKVVIEDSYLKGLGRKLRDLDIKPDYVVECGDEKAPTIILFAQVHSNPGVTKELAKAAGIVESQKQIYDGLRALAEAEIARDIYTEGLSEGFIESYDEDTPEEQEGNEEDIPEELKEKDYDKHAVIEVMKDSKGAVNLLGIENKFLHRRAVKALLGYDLRQREDMMELRMSAHNLVIAETVARTIKPRGESLQAMVLGAGHEYGLFNPNYKHPMKASEALAYEGFNVIVVDACSPYFKKEEVIALMYKK